VIVSMVLIGAGLLMIVFRGDYARSIADSQKSLWNLKYTTKDLKVTRLLSLLIGAALVLIGVVRLL
jgi:hypothetical protein